MRGSGNRFGAFDFEVITPKLPTTTVRKISMLAGGSSRGVEFGLQGWRKKAITEVAVPIYVGLAGPVLLVQTCTARNETGEPR